MVSMKTNPDKFQFIILGNKDSYTLQMGHITTKSVSSVTLLGITDDLNWTLKKHISKISKKARYKLHAPRGTTKISNIRKSLILACSIIESRFAYCPLIWMLHLKIDMQRVERYNKYKTWQVVITIPWLHMIIS